MGNIRVILLISGKRKCGKDYISEKLRTMVGVEKCTIVRISGPLKLLYAQNHGLDFNELLSNSPYKEEYRKDMIEWSDKIRDENPGYFCKAACDSASKTPLWIVSDIRRKTDIKWFKDTYGSLIRTIRIIASDEVRKQRGWIYTCGVDDVISECGLDDYVDWDYQVENNTEEECKKAIEIMMGIVREMI